MVNQNKLTIKQLSDLAGVSVRTLHYYDQIGLLTPQRVRENNYRSYSQESLLRLQQILFYRELGFSLEQIGSILNAEGFDLIRALECHREALKFKVNRINTLLDTIDKTIQHLEGQTSMAQNQYFTGFNAAQQAEYEKEAAQRWDPQVVHESNRRWKALSKPEQRALMQRGESITLALRDVMPKGADSTEAQQLVGDWQKHIGFFYVCTDEILLGLGRMYVEDARFKAFYDRIDPNLAEFLHQAIEIYCSGLGVKQ